MLTPLPRNSFPIATPRRRIKSLSHVAPTVIYIEVSYCHSEDFGVVGGFAYSWWEGGIVVGVAVNKFQRKRTLRSEEMNVPNTKRSILQA